MSEVETLAGRVQRVLTEHHLTLTELARAARISRHTISSCISGQRQVSPPTARQLTKALNDIEGIQPADKSPSLLYFAMDGSRHRVDADGWDPKSVTPRELAMCRALLTHSLARLDNYPIGGERR